MTNRFGWLALCLLAIGPCASAQSTETPARFPADQRSNGVLELSVAQAPDPSVRPDLFPPDNIWHGMVVVSLKNVSPFAIRLSESALTYEFTVLDSSGRRVPPTERGKERLASQQEAHQGRPFVMGPISSFDLRSGDTRTSSFRLSHLYEIQPGADYTIQFKYSWNMPKSDGAGRPITQRELAYMLKAKGGVMAH